MCNKIAPFINQSALSTLMEALSSEQKMELSKFAVQKQIEIDATIRLAQQSGLVHENQINAAISKIAAAGEVDQQTGMKTKFDTTIESPDGKIRTHITSSKSWWS